MTIGNDTVYEYHAGGGIPTLNTLLYYCSNCITFFWYVLSTYRYELNNFVQMSTYWYVLVCTSTNQVHTKNTVLVQQVRIPDDIISKPKYYYFPIIPIIFLK